MAKRAVPEINAGSMADIAFLLLIFFLVTTTMDRDQAYQKRIPKPPEIPPPVTETFARDKFEMIVDQNGRILVKGRFDGQNGRPLLDVDQLADKIVEFFNKNRRLTQEQINAITATQAAYDAYEGKNFPFYSRATRDILVQGRDNANSQIDYYDETGDESMIMYYTNMMSGYSDKIKVLDFIKQPELVEVAPSAHIRLEVLKATPYELYVTIHQEIEKATHALRNEVADELGWESYTEIKRRYDINEGDPKKEDQNNEDFAKLEALKMLHPVRVIEVTPK